MIKNEAPCCKHQDFKAEFAAAKLKIIIKDGKIAVINTDKISGKESIDAKAGK